MGPKKGKAKMPVDGVDTTSMTREQLEVFCIRLREELDREREERNFFQLERDKLRTFWEITRQQLEESRAQQRNQDRAIDEQEQKHQEEIKVYKQKVKHLLYEHQCNLSELRIEDMVTFKQAQDDFTAMEQQLLKDKKELKEQIHDMELKRLEEIRQLKMDHSTEVSRIREQLESDATELEKKFEARLTNQAEEQFVREKMEQAELETRKNQHIVDLTKQHETAFQEMKNYYNDITLNNLALISTLKEQIEELKANHDRMEKQLTACQAENKKLAEPFKQAQGELGLLRRQLTSYEQDKVNLANTKQRLSLVMKELEDLRWENDVLELRFEKVEKERDRLHTEFVGAVLDVQQKSGLKGALLEKRMASAQSGVSQSSGVSITGCSTEISDSQKSSSSKKSPPDSTGDSIACTASVANVTSAGVTPCRWNRLRSSWQKRNEMATESSNDKVAPKHFEFCGVRGRSCLRRPRLLKVTKEACSERVVQMRRKVLAVEPTEKDDGWSEVLKKSGPHANLGVTEFRDHPKESWWPNVDSSHCDETTVAHPTSCFCGQHVNGCRVSTYDPASQIDRETLNLTFNSFGKNSTKHRYYPQVLDSVHRSLSPIYSQEHPSESSIHDSPDKPAMYPQKDGSSHSESFDTNDSKKIRPFSASRSDGRDQAFAKPKPLNFPAGCRSKTAPSKVSSKLVPLPLLPQPDLPCLHGIKSRYSSIHKGQKRKASWRESQTSMDVEIQHCEHSSNCWSNCEGTPYPANNLSVPDSKSVPDGQTYSYFSEILSNPFQISYMDSSVSHMDRNYAAVVTSPNCDDLTVAAAFPKSVKRGWTMYSASLTRDDSIPNRRRSRQHTLAASSTCVVDIESEGSEFSGPALNTPINASNEGMGTSLSSFTTSTQLDLNEPPEPSTLTYMENTMASDQHRWPSRESSVERKRELTPLKRKFKATVLRRLKLKLMICSYMHRHDEEGDVNFVHPSARKRSVEPSPLHRFTNSSFEVLESSSEVGTTKCVLAEPSHSAPAPADVPPCTCNLMYQYFCCVCNSDTTSLWDPAAEVKVCCKECQKKADVLLEEYERSQATLKKELDDDLVIDVTSGKSTQADTEIVRCHADCDEPPSNEGSGLWTKSCRGRRASDSFDAVRSTNSGAERCFKRIDDGVTLSGYGDVNSPDKHLQDSFKNVLENKVNTVSEARLDVDGHGNAPELSRSGLGGGEKDSSSKDNSGKAEDVLFTLSSVQTAIRAAMAMIKPRRPLSPLESPVTVIVSPANSSRPATPTITSPVEINALCTLASSCTPSDQNRKTPIDTSTPQVELQDSDQSQSNQSEPNSDRQQCRSLSPAASDDPSQSEHEGFIPCQPSSDVQQQQHPSLHELESACVSSSITTGDDLRNSVLSTLQRKHKGTCASTKPFYVCPLAVPRGMLKEKTRKVLYTEYPVQTHSIPSKKVSCLPKPNNLLVFYEVSKIRNASERVKAKTRRNETENNAKDCVSPPGSLSRVSHVNASRNQPVSSSQFMLRPSRSSLLVSDGIPTVDRQSIGIKPINEPMKCTDDTASLSEFQTPVANKRGFSKFSHGRFDLLMRRRRESWILSEESYSSKVVTESGKFRHHSERVISEDEIRLSGENQTAFAAYREKRCQCLKRGRKCNCNLTNHLYIRPLNLPRQLNKARESPSPRYCERVREHPNRQTPAVSSEERRSVQSGIFREGVSKESSSNGENTTSRLGAHSDSHGNPKTATLGRCNRPKILGQMSTLIEDSSECLSHQEDGSGAFRAPVIPMPPPPSPTPGVYLCPRPCPPLSARRDALARRRVDKVSLRETRTCDPNRITFPSDPRRRPLG